MSMQLKCFSCGKVLSPPALDEDAEGLEGFIARNLPVLDKAFCSDVCLERGKLQ